MDVDISNDEAIKLINSSVQGLGIDYCRPRKSGIIALKVTDENNRSEIINRLNKNAELSTNYKAKLPEEVKLEEAKLVEASLSVQGSVHDVCSGSGVPEACPRWYKMPHTLKLKQGIETDDDFPWKHFCNTTSAHIFTATYTHLRNVCYTSWYGG